MTVSKAQSPSSLHWQPGYDLSIGTTASLLSVSRSIRIHDYEAPDDVHDESHLLAGGRVATLQDLDRNVRSEGNSLGRLERVRVVSVVDRKGVVAGKRGQVEGGEEVEDNDLVRRIGVDGLVEGEVGLGRVEGRVGRRVVLGDRRLGESGDKLLEVSQTLGGTDRGSEALVVVE